MKIDEVLHMPGVENFMNPSTFINAQVVQPQSKQAVDPDQDSFNLPAKKTKGIEEIDTDELNGKQKEVIKNYFDDDEKWKKLATEVGASIFAIDDKHDIKKSSGFTEFTKLSRKLKNLY